MNSQPNMPPTKERRPESIIQRLFGTRLRVVLPWSRVGSGGRKGPRVPSGPSGKKTGLGRVRSALFWVVGGGGLVGFVFALSFYLAMRVEMRGNEVLVPDLAGQTLDGAQALADDAKLVLEIVDRRNDPAVPSERVLQQDPSAGASVKRGRKVKLILSLGDRVLNVPDLVGKASRTVEIELRRGGFAPGYEVHVPSATEVGVVLAQVPPSDSPAVPKSRVHRLVSDGPPRPAFVMPDLVARSRNTVEDWAKRAGFRVAVRSVAMEGQPPGIIIGQLPLSGHPVHSSDVIEITVVR